MNDNSRTKLAAEASSFHQLITDLWRASTTPIGKAASSSGTFTPCKPLLPDDSGTMGPDFVARLSAESTLLKGGQSQLSPYLCNVRDN